MTKGEDGDPLDAMALHDTASFPGVVLPCRLMGMLDVDQKGKKGRESNPRLILVPVWHDRLEALQSSNELPVNLKDQIEHFFVSTTFFTGKDAKVKGWAGAKEAERLIRKCACG
jgi:inorganic pyrophosphatase